MSKVVRRENRKRGFFGWVFKLLFIGFNLLMVVWLFAYWMQVGDMMNNASSSAAKTGAAIGTTIGTSFILFFWAAGDLILGLLTVFTRGKTVVVEEIIS